MSNLIDAFNKIGVSYESGNGDYAEWLPRADVSEEVINEREIEFLNSLAAEFNVEYE